MNSFSKIMRDFRTKAAETPVKRPLFALLHPSARPEKWRAIYDAWMKAAVNPDDVEYVLCVDTRWGFPGTALDHDDTLARWNGERHSNTLTWNEGRRCYVDAVNTAAKASTGRILIVIADDQWPCEGWDEQLTQLLERAAAGDGTDPARWPDGAFWSSGGTLWPKEFVIEVSTGTPQEHNRGIMPMPILSRARYERLGYVFYPEYESMYADNDFCEHARRDGVVIDARHLMFPHIHPYFDESGRWRERAELDKRLDAAYREQNRQSAYELGHKLLHRRRAAKFDGIARESSTAAVVDNVAPVIAVCLPGETFSHHWVAAWTQLFTHLLKRGFSVAPCFQHCSNVYFTRQALAKCVQECTTAPSFVLWIDDDQILTPEHFDLLMGDLQGLPQADIVAGWSWIELEGNWAVSAGKHSADGKTVTFVPREEVERLRALGQVAEVEWTGFPAVLMRANVLEKAAEQARQRTGVANPFAPLAAPNSVWGFTGEDIAFCVNAKDAGCKIYLDARVEVPHLKLRALVPPPLPVAKSGEKVEDPAESWPVLV